MEQMAQTAPMDGYNRKTPWKRNACYNTCPLWGNPQVTSGFSSKRAGNTESILSWHHLFEIHFRRPLWKHPRRSTFFSMMTSSNGNIFRVTGSLGGKFTGHRLIPLTKASDAELWCFFFICAWINNCVNNREAGDLRRHRAHYDVTVMPFINFDIWLATCNLKVTSLYCRVFTARYLDDLSKLIFLVEMDKTWFALKLTFP